MSRTNKFGLSIDDRLYAFLTDDVLPGTGLDSEAFFEGFSTIVHELSPKNRELLAKRDALQEKLDGWYRQNGAPVDIAAYE